VSCCEIVFFLCGTFSAAFFSALHGMPARTDDEKGPSVRLSVCQTHAKRKKDMCSFLYHTMVGGGDPFYLKFWVNRSPSERNRDFEPIFAQP